MGRKREERPVRKMKPVFLVFCEGETEENYLNFIKREYKSPIKIISKTEGDSISQRLINQRKKEIVIYPHEDVSVFLMYDLDVETISAKLKKCNAVWLCSNPCIELWYLLHSKDQKKSITTASCINALKKAGNCWAQYAKPGLTDTQKQHLRDNKSVAVTRAKALSSGGNPSSSIYKLLDAIDEFMG